MLLLLLLGLLLLGGCASTVEPETYRVHLSGVADQAIEITEDAARTGDTDKLAEKARLLARSLGGVRPPRDYEQQHERALEALDLLERGARAPESEGVWDVWSGVAKLYDLRYELARSESP